MKVLLIAPNVDGTDVGEAHVAFKWAKALSTQVDLTVLAFQRPGRAELSSQLPGVRVITWPEPRWAMHHERLNAMLKPAWPVLAKHVLGWLKGEEENGTRFDIAHQLMPQAARYASPLRHFDVPYVIGPLGGALDTPDGFRTEAATAPLFTRLRALDRWRFRHDPFLRASYKQAACVLGVAPYVRNVLADVPLRRFEPMLELGIDALAPATERLPRTQHLNVLHVGRGVRTKGLRDSVRALAHLKDLPGIRLTSAGEGEEIDYCRAEAQRLGVEKRVTFLGKIPRAAVEDLYATHDAFCFPSFREPAGGVLYEAMRHGLPVVTADRGGPAWIIDASCGLKVPVTQPDDYAKNIATALRQLAQTPDLRQRLGNGARQKVARDGLWPAKASRLVELYGDILGPQSVPAPLRKDRCSIPC